MASNLLHDLIKIKYINEGYLPNTPYHQISDNEMLNAFIHNDNDWEFGEDGDVVISISELPYLHGYFIDTYPCPSDDLLESYAELISSIVTNSYYSYKSLGKGDVNWVYSYMLGNAVGQYSSIPDKHDLLVMLGTDNTYDEYDEKSAKACLATSREYLNRIGNNLRAPTMFGEPHVIKALRLKESNL